ncbi:MAG: hypothetical protein JSV44_12540 [Candidatus Zixiibacteriota bacterium]|nr:MAG: hypothetical protein JSV44_12540 [candidate division Zixibacteria bacterium]
MNRAGTRISGAPGASILETLVALILAGIVTTAIFKVYINQHKNWSIQEHITDMQQNARAAIDELTRQIRMAGFQIPLHLSGIQARNSNPDSLTIVYRADECEVTTMHDMINQTSVLQCDGQDVSCFSAGQWVYIYHPNSGGGEFFQIDQILPAFSHIQPASLGLSQVYAKDAIIMALEQITYFIDYSDTLHPRLMMQLPGRPPQVYAENIEDLQFRYRMKNGMILDVPAIADDVREVRLSIIARAKEPDPDFPSDPYRRRAYNSSVNLRNL